MTDDQLSLVPAKKKRVKAPVPIAENLPVAQIVIDSPLPHLDRLFDYAVPAPMDAAAQPGVRVRVRFAGKLVDGFLIARAATTEHLGTLAAITSVVSPEPVLMPEILELAQTVATRQAGTLWDVLRSAIPNRHANTEALQFPEPAKVEAPELGVWTDYIGGPALVTRTCQGQAPRAVVTTGTDDVAEMLARYAATVAANEKSVIIIVPDRAAIDRVVASLIGLGCPLAAIATVAADDGPSKRYRNWLAVLRGVAPIVVGTRSAVFAPAQKLAAICVWDDWNDTLSDPHAPYWHARDVAVLRSAQQETALVLIGATMSTPAHALQPWLAHIARGREQQRSLAPRVRSALDETYLKNDPAAHGTRMPALVMQVAKKALEDGPVLVLVNRTGYTPRLTCDACRTAAECSSCHGPLIATSRSSAPTCSLCGHQESAWTCANCKGTKVRAGAIGSERTAEEFGRAFPGVPVRSSSADHIVRSIDSRPAIIVATAGAAPTTPNGYAAALLLDGHAMLSRPELTTTEETFAKWMECVSLVRPGGEVVVVADPEHHAVQALIRHDPAGFAQRELEQRQQVQLPPAVRLVSLTGTLADIDDLLQIVDLPEGVTQRGPVPTGEGSVRMLLSIARAQGVTLAQAVKVATVIRSAKHKGQPVNVRVDPQDI
mgnify:CR=1 FL=1